MLDELEPLMLKLLDEPLLLDELPDVEDEDDDEGDEEELLDDESLLELLLELELDELLELEELLELLLPSQQRQPIVKYADVSSWKWQTICWLASNA
ncbi:hypothetical protein Poly59_54150 [Rubripirellula reticaptiva]|uniref:Uncharacterized protein n=2 Tax=Rubripirellula reticaptiva TaxID=2528013 RepID=A0A5C6EBV3_9BACT|nr:hypothetical protein Poly59_54150 [Rubripirellula reticaptiva]